MFHVIPGNRLELLVEPLKILLAVEKQHVLASDWILLPHRGMQHWLNMELANSPDRQISMNMNMHLPASGIWQLVHQILGKEAGRQSVEWRREALSWKLHDLLTSAELLNHPLMAEPTAYWQSGPRASQELKRFQLAEQVADLFEQYLIYRPDWIKQWQQDPAEHWQALLWQYLVRQSGHHPLGLLDAALQQIDRPVSHLPERVFIFAVNNLAPLWLDFFKQVSDQAGIDFHFFYLNPSDEYWSDQVSEKQAAKLRAKWFEQGIEELVLDTGNALLSSLGFQGQAFINLLSERADLETPVFDDPGSDSFLKCLQHDLLFLKNTPRSNLDDTSIHVVSAYSALREVQGLHDWLLGQFNDNPSLKPRDVLVMCPEIEQYAPYIDAVFARGYDHLSEQLPPLPCSISDRGIMSADPLVNAFVSFFDLPDSRLQVRQMMAWLNVPAIQQHFGFSQESLVKVESWLDQAHIHWGLNAQHKARFLSSPNHEVTTTETYTWKLGLERLLLGFAWGDETALVDNRLMLPQIEGSDALLLGQLISFVDRLETLSRTLTQARTAEQWVALLQNDILIALFGEQSDNRSYQLIEHCLSEFLVRIHESGASNFSDENSHDGTIDSQVMRYYLQQELNRPETTANQYLMGQITFCSMVPMRSVPFKIIAVLGLNDGDYPRQRQPVGFDLMADGPMRRGDRSRRGDDRYLFLETIMSARQQLYLSYQGNSIKDNAARQPSLLLEELLDYLQQHYGWNRKQLHQLPMQFFSPDCYQGNQPSFDPVGLRLLVTKGKAASPIRLEPTETRVKLSAAELIRFFNHPSEQFSRQQLGLFMNSYDTELEDVEPFAGNHLQRYQIQDNMINTLIHSRGDEQKVADLIAMEQVSGSLPELESFQSELNQWRQQAESFYREIDAEFNLNLDPNLDSNLDSNLEPTTLSGEFMGRTLSVTLIMSDTQELVYWRLAKPGAKDFLTLWCNQLIAQVLLGKPLISRGLYRGKTDDEFHRLELQAIDQPEALLEQWLAIFDDGQTRPLLYNAKIGTKLAASTASFQKIWESDRFTQGLDQDLYLKYFWPELPTQAEIDLCVELYVPMMSLFLVDGKGVKL